MKFASAKQIIGMIVVSAALLYALDYWKNPQLWGEEAGARPVEHRQADAAELTLWMNGAGSLAEVRQALSGVEGIDLGQARAAARADGPSAVEARTSVSLPITDLAKLDFVALDRGLRQNGLVAGRMELSGVRHFGLETDFPHLSGQLTAASVEERMGYVKALGLGRQLEWLDSVTMNSQHKTLMAYARYVEPGKSVDVAELLAGLNQIGLAPNSLRVVLGERSAHGSSGRSDEAHRNDTQSHRERE